jgi:hypothetical protein
MSKINCVQVHTYPCTKPLVPRVSTMSTVLLPGVSPFPEKPLSQVLAMVPDAIIIRYPWGNQPALPILPAYQTPSPHVLGLPYSIVMEACYILSNRRGGTIRPRTSATPLTSSTDGHILPPVNTFIVWELSTPPVRPTDKQNLCCERLDLSVFSFLAVT